jgi:hypothetical protein
MNCGLHQLQPADCPVKPMLGFDTQYDIAFALDQQTTAGHLGKMTGTEIMVNTFTASRQP